MLVFRDPSHIGAGLARRSASPEKFQGGTNKAFQFGFRKKAKLSQKCLNIKQGWLFCATRFVH